MKQILLPLFLFASICLSAQTKYYDAAQFPLLGKVSQETETRYERLPAALNGNARAPVWALGKNTSGLAVRFRSNTTSVSAKWELLQNNHMDHMTDVGIKGLDLYAWESGRWQFVNSARPTGKSNEKPIISHMAMKEREYLLFLPLYDGVTKLEIGIDSAAVIAQPALELPQSKKAVVVYGTSITQGGCANRPGMSFTNILMRKLNREFINLGFSGNGKLDYEIAEVMANKHDAGLFILDFIPNVHASQIKERTGRFVNIIRSKNKTTPLLFVETIMFPHAVFDKATHEVLTIKNKALYEEYLKVKNSGDKNVYYLSGKNLIGADGEATVDGIHLTDLGYMRMADALYPVIKNILEKRAVR
ncbi:SGNH/GDSL hydrolase family protein [Haoranjiania flava]|uniref:SGNH/GDSL hydrolase family protein n=1 Tax=Haoranjiania flava TaxID=1856322 RepID=A0AAE3IPN8_9BACT|nr:SGNH/GDSL hydrolase family protein [Haoranjiania flava]MCU7694778.1 SGNH/GDSL hydrolase family protein [Haoranjiania flava]